MLTIPRMASTLPDMISKIVFLGTWVSDMLEFSVIDSGAASWGGSVSLQFSMTGLESSSCSIYGKRKEKKNALWKTLMLNCPSLIMKVDRDDHGYLSLIAGA